MFETKWVFCAILGCFAYINHSTNAGKQLFSLVQVQNFSLRVKGLDQSRTLNSHITTHHKLFFPFQDRNPVDNQHIIQVSRDLTEDHMTYSKDAHIYQAEDTDDKAISPIYN